MLGYGVMSTKIPIIVRSKVSARARETLDVVSDYPVHGWPENESLMRRLQLCKFVDEECQFLYSGL